MHAMHDTGCIQNLHSTRERERSLSVHHKRRLKRHIRRELRPNSMFCKSNERCHLATIIIKSLKTCHELASPHTVSFRMLITVFFFAAVILPPAAPASRPSGLKRRAKVLEVITKRARGTSLFEFISLQNASDLTFSIPDCCPRLFQTSRHQT
jgi:hypothetical protein